MSRDVAGCRRMSQECRGMSTFDCVSQKCRGMSQMSRKCRGCRENVAGMSQKCRGMSQRCHGVSTPITLRSTRRHVDTSPPGWGVAWLIRACRTWHQRPCRCPLRPERAPLASWATPAHASLMATTTTDNILTVYDEEESLRRAKH